MEEKQPPGNIEEQRDFDPAREKRTLADNREKGGLNDGNPNVDHTPATRSQEASKEMGTQPGESNETGGTTA
jgi:hypothetical protein